MESGSILYMGRTSCENKRIIVSLTSYPARINTVQKAIISILKQKVKPDKIILWLSDMEFPLHEKDLPLELRELCGKNGFEIRWVNENIKSHKKYFYALQEYANSIVITIDDDMEYNEMMIHDLIKSHQVFPNTIIARCARIIVKEGNSLSPYQHWDLCFEKYCNKPRMDLCAIGVGGVLYPPSCASRRWFEVEKLINLTENQDDLWLKYNEIIDGVSTFYVKPTGKDMSIKNEKEDSLSKHNLHGDGNNLCVDRLCREVQEKKEDIVIDWFSELLTKNEYELSKKKIYLETIRKNIADMKDNPIYIFGAGKLAEILLKILVDCKMISNIKGLLVSEKKNNPDIIMGIEVKQLDELDKNENINVIMGISSRYEEEVYSLLKNYKCKCFHLDFQPIKNLYDR